MTARPPSEATELRNNSLRVGGRDQSQLRVEDVDQVIKIPGAAGITGGFEQFLASDLICPLMSVPVPGSRAFSTAWAACWCSRCWGLRLPR